MPNQEEKEEISKEKLITLKEAQELLKSKYGLKREIVTLQNLCRAGELTAENTNSDNPRRGSWLVSPQSIESYAINGRHEFVKPRNLDYKAVLSRLQNTDASYSLIAKEFDTTASMIGHIARQNNIFRRKSKEK